MSEKDFQTIQHDKRYEIKGATQTLNGWLVFLNTCP